LMRVLWEKQSATVSDLVGALTGKPVLAYNTVLTIMRILDRKGYVAHEKAGRAFVYRPLIDQSHVRQSAIRHLASRLFENSASLLVLNLLKDEQLDGHELERLKKLIEEVR
jgi:BlaI family transcriptional regulator, penicillinase repressor